MELDHGAAIVTGAAGGIGSVIARRLTAAGMSVVMADLDATRLESERASVLGAYPDAR
ncbi:MAG: SDR family NAD(P)-dependent oxidoreductase, partial [Microthrixaceae bacterium]|nr:SDR family NAD(P)-dependent oxidoreductase [Microthrixaceae bacterium]